MSDVISKIIDKVENRYYGKYRATVSDNDDKENLGRLRLYVPELLGEKNKTGWALPCVPYGGSGDSGFFLIPEINSNVWVEFEGGNLSYPIWTGTWWDKSNTSAPKESKNIQDNSIKILKTRSGHKIEFNDNTQENESSILIASSKGFRIYLNESSNDSKIEVQTKKGHKLRLDDTNDQIELQTTVGNLLKIENAGMGNIILKTSNGNSIEMNANSKSTSITTTGKTTIKSTEMEIESLGNMNIKAGGILNLQGTLIKLN